MKVEDSNYIYLEHQKNEFYFGTFYFFKGFIIGELNDGIHFDLIKVLQVVDKIHNYYEEGIKLVYIANRVNSYSTDPQTWPKLEKTGSNFILAAGLVIYNEIGYTVAAVEKKISKTHLKRFNNLEEAVNWAINFLELKNKKQIQPTHNVFFICL